MDKQHPSGGPYCDGLYCDAAGIYSNCPKPYEKYRFCGDCLKKYVYLRRPMEFPANVTPINLNKEEKK